MCWDVAGKHEMHALKRYADAEPRFTPRSKLPCIVVTGTATCCATWPGMLHAGPQAATLLKQPDARQAVATMRSSSQNVITWQKTCEHAHARLAACATRRSSKLQPVVTVVGADAGSHMLATCFGSTASLATAALQRQRVRVTCMLSSASICVTAVAGG